MPGTLNWVVEPFESLTPQRLYAVLALRQEVFVVEQRCAYLDADGRDRSAVHLQGYQGASAEEPLVAYARLLAPTRAAAAAVIGRVVVRPASRGRGMGRLLMERAMRELATRFPGAPLRVEAQSYLVQFYRSLGFRAAGSEYLEDGIPHVAMYRACGEREAPPR